MASPDQQMHRTGPAADVSFDRPPIRAHPGALRDPAGFRGQSPALADEPARVADAIPVGAHRPGAAQHGMFRDVPAEASHVTAALRVDECEIGPFGISQKPEDAASPATTIL